MKLRQIFSLWCICAWVLFSGAESLYAATLIYRFTGVVQHTDRDTPSQLLGAPADMTVIYLTDSWAERSPYGDTANRSMLASGQIGVNGQIINFFSEILIYERQTDLGLQLFMTSDAAYGEVNEGFVGLVLPLFPIFQPDGRLFEGNHFTGNVGESGVLFSSIGLPLETNNESLNIAWNSLTLIPEPSTMVLFAVTTALISRRKRKVNLSTK